MTVAIAIPFGDKIVIGADTRILAGFTPSGAVSKIVLSASGNAMAYAGNLGTCQKAVMAVEDGIENPGQFQSHIYETEPYAECGFLWACKGGVLIAVDGDGATVAYADGQPWGIGSGADSALGFVAGARRPKSIVGTKRLVRAAIAYVASVDVSCGQEAVVLVV